MAIAFDTLGYSARLRKDGFTQEQADALSFAARDYIMPELVTKSDLQAATSVLQGDMQAFRSELRGDMQTLKSTLQGDIQALRGEVRAAIDTSALKTIIITGGMITAAVGIMLAAIPIMLK